MKLLILALFVAWGSGENAGVTLYKCLGRVNDTDSDHVVTIPAAFVSDGRVASFGLVRKELNCRKDRFKVVLDLKEGVGKVLQGDRRSGKYSVVRDEGIRVVAGRGYLKIGTDYFNPLEYCIDRVDESELNMFVCYPVCYSQFPCITKCCGLDEVYDVRNQRCRKYNVPSVNPGGNETLDWGSDNGTEGDVGKRGEVARMWEPYLFSRSVDNCVKRVTPYHREQIHVHYREQMPSCSKTVVVPLRKIYNRAVQRFRVLWTGGVIVRDKHGNWSEFTPGNFCVDGMVNFNKLSSGVYENRFQDQLVIACESELPRGPVKKLIPLKYAIMLAGSALILFTTGLISCLLWDKQNVYEWTVSCEVISMFFLILFVGIAHTIARRPEKSDFGSGHCIFVGAASHFFWLATFTWLFIINFEIWWNFRSLVQLRQSRKWFRFSVYLSLGWGCPFLVVSLGLLLDTKFGLQNENLDCATIIPPNYGQLNCYVAKNAQGPYIFFPIGVVLIFNLVFYLLTVFNMWGYQKKSSAILQHRSKAQSNHIFIFAKLFIVQGVSWVFEIVAWAVSTSDPEGVPLYWVVFDIVTLFQSLSIFVLFVWKKEVISRLYWKYPRLKGLWDVFLRLPFCSLLPNPNDRDRSASIRPQANKLPRENASGEGGGGGGEEQVVYSVM